MNYTSDELDKLVDKIREIVEEANRRGLPPHCTKYKDGRKNSAEDEETYLNIVAKIFSEKFSDINFSINKPRYWADVFVDKLPIHFKSTTGGSDNFSSKRGILYSLTDLPLEKIQKVKNDKVIKIIKNDKNKKTRPCIILVYDKNEKKLSVIDLRSVSERSLIPNGSNLPFQINWNNALNDLSVQRTDEEIRDFFICIWAKSEYKAMMRSYENYNDLQECRNSNQRCKIEFD